MKFTTLVKPLVLTLRGIVLEIVGLFAFLRFFKRLNRKQVKSILVVADYRVGDTALAMPMIDALHARWPQASIVVFVNEVAADLWRLHPAIHDVQTIQRSNFYFKRVMSIRKLGKAGYDLCIDATCDRTLLGAWFALASGARYTVGYDIAGRGFLFNKPVFRRARARHVVEEMVDLAAAVGAKSVGLVPSIQIGADLARQSEQRLQSLLQCDAQALAITPLIGLHAGSTYPTQRWLPDRFAVAADRLADRHGATILLFGTPGSEASLNARIASKMTHKPILFVGEPLALTIATIKRCRLMVCNNSGLLHVAAALNVPTVSFLGPTLAHRFKPLGPNNAIIRKNIPCIGCNSGTCLIGTHDCMQLITVDEVVDAANRLLLNS